LGTRRTERWAGEGELGFGLPKHGAVLPKAGPACQRGSFCLLARAEEPVPEFLRQTWFRSAGRSFKFMAALQRAQVGAAGCAKPMLIRIETQGSHVYRPLDRRNLEQADILVFAAKHTGLSHESRCNQVTVARGKAEGL